jgi:hypothetical protein
MKIMRNKKKKTIRCRKMDKINRENYKREEEIVNVEIERE